MIEMIKRATSAAKNFANHSDRYGTGWTRVWADSHYPILIYLKSGKTLECNHNDIKELSPNLIEIYDRHMGYRTFVDPNDIEAVATRDCSDLEKK